MATITKGTPAVFSGTKIALGNDICWLDATHCLATFCNDSDNTGQVIAGELSGTVITWGTPVSFSTVQVAESTSVCALDASTFAILYGVITGTDIKVVIGTVSGTTITITPGGTLVNGSYTDEALCSIDTLDSTHIIMVYCADSRVKATCASVSGTTPTLGTEQTISGSGANRHTSVASLSSSLFVVSWDDNGDTRNYFKAGTISGTTITLGSSAFINARVPQTKRLNPRSLTRINATTFCDLYGDISTNDTSVVLGTVSGTTITLGTKQALNTNTLGYGGLCALSETSIAVAWGDEDDAGRVGKITTMTISGTTATSDNNTETFETGSTNFISIKPSSSTAFTIVYTDGGNSNKGTYIVCSLPPPTSIKTIDGLAKGSIKTINGLAIASVKTWDGLA